jgi:pimeloyl-ACP methyl ester carboxylesterase
MLRIVPLLTDPAAHGADPGDAFDVVVPSLPKYGFSDRPAAPGMNSFRIAGLWVELMQALGYERFAAQGGDIGAGVSTALGLVHASHILGIHLNYIPGSYRPHLEATTKPSPAEQKFLGDAARWYDENGAYAHVQATRPQTAPMRSMTHPPAWQPGYSKSFATGPTAMAISPAASRSINFSATSRSTGWTQTIHSSFRLYYEN